MTTFGWILGSGLLMSALALIGSVTLLFGEETVKRFVVPLVALAAGSLLGGAFFHMLPAATAHGLSLTNAGFWLMAGFTVFLALEQFLHWHHCHRASAECKQPLTYLVLLGDGLHNFLGGIGVGSMFLLDVRLGVAAWLAAAAHEVPQELGDFGVLIHGGWKKGHALLLNMLSGVTFLVGGLVAYAASNTIDVTTLVPFAAGNFVYIGASDLVPEVNKHHSAAGNVVNFLSFATGLGLLWVVHLVVGD